jgi:hypothetical protein
MGCAGRDVEGTILLDFDEDGEARGRLLGEVKADGRLDLFGFPARLQVGIEDQQVPGIETPGEARRLRARQTAGFPEEEVADRIERIAREGELHARKAGTRFRLEALGGSAPIDQKIGVVDELSSLAMIGLRHTSWPDFNTTNVAGGG